MIHCIDYSDSDSVVCLTLSKNKGNTVQNISIEKKTPEID